jgi:hypothetical protein
MPVAALNLERPVRLAGAAVWPPDRRAYGGHAPSRLKRYLWPLRVAARLFLPVILLTVLLGAAFLYSDAVLLLPLSGPPFISPIAAMAPIMPSPSWCSGFVW